MEQIIQTIEALTELAKQGTVIVRTSGGERPVLEFELNGTTMYQLETETGLLRVGADNGDVTVNLNNLPNVVTMLNALIEASAQAIKQRETKVLTEKLALLVEATKVPKG